MFVKHNIVFFRICLTVRNDYMRFRVPAFVTSFAEATEPEENYGWRSRVFQVPLSVYHRWLETFVVTLAYVCPGIKVFHSKSLHKGKPYLSNVQII